MLRSSQGNLLSPLLQMETGLNMFAAFSIETEKEVDTSYQLFVRKLRSWLKEVNTFASKMTELNEPLQNLTMTMNPKTWARTVSAMTYLLVTQRRDIVNRIAVKPPSSKWSGTGKSLPLVKIFPYRSGSCTKFQDFVLQLSLLLAEMFFNRLFSYYRFDCIVQYL